MQLRLNKENPKLSFSDCLAMEAKDFLRKTRKQHQEDQEIDWQQFDTYLESGDDRFDTLVKQAYLELKEARFRRSKQHCRCYQVS